MSLSRLLIPGTAVLAVVMLGDLASCMAALPQPLPRVQATNLRVRTSAGIQTLPLETYVLGSVLAEVSPTSESPAVAERIFEVQAIVARTYAVRHLRRHEEAGFDLCDTTHCQIYDSSRVVTSRFAETAREAVRRTEGLILEFGGQPAEALFHADCGGQTAAADLVWGGLPLPYLIGSPDNAPSVTHRTWQFEIASSRLRTALNLDPRTQVGSRLDQIAVVERDRSGRAASIRVKGDQAHVIRGEDFRSVLNRTFGDRAIMSTRFTVTHEGLTYRFRGTGFGHGVGLCQVGAAARARRGDSTDAILRTYFPGTRLGQL